MEKRSVMPKKINRKKSRQKSEAMPPNKIGSRIFWMREPILAKRGSYLNTSKRRAINAHLPKKYASCWKY
jgi:hypothetical protein